MRIAIRNKYYPTGIYSENPTLWFFKKTPVNYSRYRLISSFTLATESRNDTLTSRKQKP